jgi:long-chain acyl-CoA synthetase
MLTSGALTLLDRSKDLVITGGANVYPREVEDVLIEHAGVADVAVIGVPDEEWGERVIAFIVPSPASSHEAPELQRALEEHCLESMARYKRPKEYHLVSQLPRNGAGKVLKTELRATLLNSESKE